MDGRFGAFPFGKPNTVRPMRPARGPAAACVVGVYPSAWHVTWTAPAYTAGAGGRAQGVKALAVDVEPTVFWNGDGSDFADRVDRWKDAVGFVDGNEPGAHGHIEAKAPAANGSSGKKVEERYLAPLGFTADEATFTDVYPVFVVKYASGARREQGDAIAEEYDSVAAMLGQRPSSLPKRPSPARLPRLAVEEFGERVVADLEASEGAGAQVVITLGEEAFQVLARLRQLDPSPPTIPGATEPVTSLLDLYGDGYGTDGSLRVNGNTLRWLPVAHPGLLKGSAPADMAVDPGRRTLQGWSALHARWESRAAHDPR